MKKLKIIRKIKSLAEGYTQGRTEGIYDTQGRKEGIYLTHRKEGGYIYHTQGRKEGIYITHKEGRMVYI